MIRAIYDVAQAGAYAIGAWSLKQLSTGLEAVQRQLPSDEPEGRERKPARRVSELWRRGAKKTAA